MKRWDKPEADVIGDIEKAIDRLPRPMYTYSPELRELLMSCNPTHLVWDEELEAYVREEIEDK